MEAHLSGTRPGAVHTRGAPVAPAPRQHRRPGVSGSTVTVVVTASPHSQHHHRLCPWRRAARASPCGAPGRHALSAPVLLPRQGARGPRPDRPALNPAQQQQCGPGHSHLASLQLGLLTYETEQKRAVRSRPALGARPAREAIPVAVTSAPHSVCRQPAEPPSLPALLLVAASSQRRDPPHAAGAQAAFQGLLHEGLRAQVCRAEAFERKERPQLSDGSARNGAARQVATGSETPRPDGRAQRCVRKEITVPCPSGLLPEPPPRNRRKATCDAAHPSCVRGEPQDTRVPGCSSRSPTWTLPGAEGGGRRGERSDQGRGRHPGEKAAPSWRGEARGPLTKETGARFPELPEALCRDTHLTVGAVPASPPRHQGVGLPQPRCDLRSPC